MSAAERAAASRKAQGLDEHVTDPTVLGLVADLALNGSSPGHHNRGCESLPSSYTTTAADLPPSASSECEEVLRHVQS